MKREASYIPMRLTDFFPDAVPENFAADRAGGVFDNGDSMSSCHLEHRFQIAGHAHLMNAQDGSRPLTDGTFDPPRIDIECSRIDINEDRARATIANAVCGSDVGMADCNDFIARANPNRQESQMQGSRSAGNSARVRCSDEGREFLFKGRDLRPLCNPTR